MFPRDFGSIASVEKKLWGFCRGGVDISYTFPYKLEKYKNRHNFFFIASNDFIFSQE